MHVIRHIPSDVHGVPYSNLLCSCMHKALELILTKTMPTSSVCLLRPVPLLVTNKISTQYGSSSQNPCPHRVCLMSTTWFVITKTMPTCLSDVYHMVHQYKNHAHIMSVRCPPSGSASQKPCPHVCLMSTIVFIITKTMSQVCLMSSKWVPLLYCTFFCSNRSRRPSGNLLATKPQYWLNVSIPRSHSLSTSSSFCSYR